jgi:starch phosphorylase
VGCPLAAPTSGGCEAVVTGPTTHGAPVIESGLNSGCVGPGPSSRRVRDRLSACQIVYAGKAHPTDADGKAIIQRIVELKEALRDHIRIAYLENYDIEVGKLMTPGVDVWLNTPQPPMEASGTSGMKAALNGVPSLSVLDGWWIEGHIEGVTGWSIGEEGRGDDRLRDAASLYDKLERLVIPMLHHDRRGFVDIATASRSMVRSSIPSA